jgi:hypothetical protein
MSTVLMCTVLMYFFIGFVSDLILNYLSRQAYAPVPIKALRVYFQRNNNAFVTAVYAGLTIVAALLVTMLCSFMIFKFSHPRTLPELWKFLVLAFPIGYLADVIIYKTELFGPTLNPYYKVAGVGFWGAAAFLFSIVLSFFITKQNCLKIV